MKNETMLKIESGEVSFNTKYGAEIYRRSLSILLECAISELYPQLKIEVGQTLMKGYYYELSNGGTFPGGFIPSVTERMREIVKSDEKFRRVVLPRARALSICRRAGRWDKYKAIKFLPKKRIEFVFLRRYFDFVLAECLASTGALKTFRLLEYNRGFILQFPVRGNIRRLPNTKDRQRKLYRVYMETKEWNGILGIRNAGDLNQAILDGSISTLIKIQEAFHEKKIARIADRIKKFFPEKKVICVAGPSASGKTTFLKRLGIEIRANGLLPVEISLDNYFVSRDKTPKTPDGDYDYECLEAIDLKFFRQQIRNLLSGKSVNLPEYNFKRGRREFTGGRLKLKENSVILIEGIHALNPRLLPGITKSQKYNIFVSALTQLRIDNDNRIFTSDSRLIRRIVRDFKFRGYSAAESIRRFPKVRLGEDKYIFPHQAGCDVFFNSSLIYEQAVIKKMASTLLRKIKKTDDVYFEAQRLLYYLDFFLPISHEEVPQNSILREFIGESSFHY